MSLRGISDSWLHSHHGLDCAIATGNQWLTIDETGRSQELCHPGDTSLPSIPASGYLNAVPLTAPRVTL